MSIEKPLFGRGADFASRRKKKQGAGFVDAGRQGPPHHAFGQHRFAPTQDLVAPAHVCRRAFRPGKGASRPPRCILRYRLAQLQALHLQQRHSTHAHSIHLQQAQALFSTLAAFMTFSSIYGGMPLSED